MKVNDKIRLNGKEYTIISKAPITNGADIQTDWMHDDMVDELQTWQGETFPAFWRGGNLYVVEYKMRTNRIYVRCVYPANPKTFAENQRDISCYLTRVNGDNGNNVYFDAHTVGEHDVECSIWYYE